MPVLTNSKHERFAQAIVKGLSVVDAFASAGYSRASAASNSRRLRENEGISARIRELQNAVAERVVAVEASNRSWRLRVLQDRIDRMLALSDARAVMYGNQLGEARRRLVNNAAEQKLAIAEGFQLEQALESDVAADVWPKEMYHPGCPNGGATGLLVKDYRGKNAEQEIWKFDSGLEARIAEDLKQAAIEVGDWSEKRDQVPPPSLPVRVTVVFVTPPARDETGEIIEVEKTG